MKSFIKVILILSFFSCGKKNTDFLINFSTRTLPKPAETPDFDYYEWITRHPNMAKVFFTTGDKENQFKIALEDGNNNGRYNDLGKDIIHILPIDGKVVEFGDFCNNGVRLSDTTLIKYKNDYFEVNGIDTNAICKWIKLKKSDKTSIENAIFIDSDLPNIKCLSFYPKKKYENIKDLAKLTGKDFTLISFWASWCSPCVAEIPQINSLQKKVTIFNFNADTDKYSAINIIVNKKLLGYHFDADPNTSRLFCQGMFPTLLLYDKKFNLVLRTVSIDEIIQYISTNGG